MQHMSSKSIRHSICMLSLQLMNLFCLEALMHGSYYSSGYSIDLSYTCPNCPQLVTTMLVARFAYGPADTVSVIIL